ncbi:redox-active protein [Porphyromonas sp.]|uniref:redox-active protein n=1 Tax=Porphyromonas sp. TaxID=1924944 RepID=UPI0026DACF5C|nr:redox-active protein [Porphyromonas sp.]MDO4770896.1 redox-active protein [Porphyromonas sp.]
MAKSTDFFHNKSNNWNCAQSIQKGFQNITKMSDEEIELTYRPAGGGRAEGGLCGALYSAEKILEEKGLPSIKEEFTKIAGGSTCRELKGEKKFPCNSAVDLAEELLAKRLKEAGLDE